MKSCESRVFCLIITMPKNTILKQILIWRAKYISHRQFVYILSVIIGFTSGLGAVLLKNPAFAGFYIMTSYLILN